MRLTARTTLPVLPTCGDCAHLQYAEPRTRCEHPSLGARTVVARHITTHASTPPAWCPLRREVHP